MPKTTSARSRKLSKALRKHHAQARQIARKEKIPYLEARRRTKERFIETIKRGKRRFTDMFMEVTDPRETPTSRRRWKQLTQDQMRRVLSEKGGVEVQRALAKKIGARGSLKFRQVETKIRSFQYWNLVDRTARMFGLPIQEARRLLTRMRQEMTMTARIHGVRRKYRTRDAAAVLEFSDRYQNVRLEFGI